MTTCQAQVNLTLGGPSGEGQVGMIKMGSVPGRGERQKGISSMIMVKTTVSIYQELA